MLELIFWLCAALVLYVYVGYPLLLKLVHALAGRTPVHEPTLEPPLTLVISAFNEEASIREKLDHAEVPKAFEGLGIAFVTAGLLSLAFLGFSGMISV
jgi:electron transport complex protein RnfA